MSMPFYVSPEQLMKDRADFARKGIARGRSVVVVQYADGVLFASEPKALHAGGLIDRAPDHDGLRDLLASVRTVPNDCA